MPTPPAAVSYGLPLSQSDYDALERCYITREVADSALLRRVTSEEGKQAAGRRDHEDYAGVLYSYVWPGEASVRAHRLRRDNPPFEIRGGQRREKEKYLSAPGYGNALYFHPDTPPESLTDARYPLVFVEGQKKCLAVFRLAFDGHSESTSTPPFIPIGLNGVWGWRDRREKTTNAVGRRVSVSAPVPDLRRIVLHGRKVYILFDTNVQTNAR